MVGKRRRGEGKNRGGEGKIGKEKQEWKRKDRRRRNKQSSPSTSEAEIKLCYKTAVAQRLRLVQSYMGPESNMRQGSFLQLKFKTQFVQAVLPLAKTAVGAVASKGGSKGGNLKKAKKKEKKAHKKAVKKEEKQKESS